MSGNAAPRNTALVSSETPNSGVPSQQEAALPLVVISATFTAEPVGETLAFWFRHLDFSLRIKFAPYNQVFQQLLDPASLISSNADGINVLLLRLEDWTPFRASGGQPQPLMENCRQFASALAALAARRAAPVVLSICPPSPAFLSLEENRQEHLRALEYLRRTAAELPGVIEVAAEEVERLYPVAEVHDPHGDEIGHVPYTPDYFVALGTMLARRIHALRTSSYKVVVLDCDDTLWSGICGEDGPLGVRIDPPRKALQEKMLRLRGEGYLLALCSKNNEEDVVETFRAHPEMVLRLEHFAAHRINWDPKPSNLASLAEELRLGLDAFVFIDDNPKECAEVQANLPEVLSLPLPADPWQIPRFLDHIWAFDSRQATEEDRRRSEMYLQESERRRFAEKSSSLAEFLAGLQLDIRIQPLQPHQLARAAQLTQRTNQMNASSVRRSEAEIRSLVESGHSEALIVDVSDRFGAYGLTGLAIFRQAGEALFVDTFLLSCRVLGRGVEYALLRELGRIALERGLERVDVLYVPTAKNRPALKFLEAVGGPCRMPVEGGAAYQIPARVAAEAEYAPGDLAPPLAPSTTQDTAPERERRPRIPYLEIAQSLSSVASIRERMRAGASLLQPAGALSGDFSGSPLERRLASLWAELLGVPRVGLRDNFFDLGGHSLMAVELLSRVRREFDVELSLEVVYSGDFTVERLARAIELKRLGEEIDPEYSDLLKELENLSEEEVQALLAEPEAPHGHGGTDRT